jgi:hypothetical protein
MKSRLKAIDTFQIVGFAVSVVISIALILAKQDTISSVTLGLVLAILTQLFDLQIRQSNSEEQLLKATSLSQALYQDQWLLNHINQIVDAYLTVKTRNFHLFMNRAEHSIVECRNVLYGMAEGHLAVEPRSAFSFGEVMTDKVKNSYKHVAASPDMAYWRETYGQKGTFAKRSAIERGVKVTRIFVQKLDTLREFVDVLQTQSSIGIQVYVAFRDELPRNLCYDYVIADDSVAAQMETSAVGEYRQQRITIDPIEVENLVRSFELTLHHSRKLEEVIDILLQDDTAA